MSVRCAYGLFNITTSADARIPGYGLEGIYLVKLANSFPLRPVSSWVFLLALKGESELLKKFI